MRRCDWRLCQQFRLIPIICDQILKRKIFSFLRIESLLRGLHKLCATRRENEILCTKRIFWIDYQLLSMLLARHWLTRELPNVSGAKYDQLASDRIIPWFSRIYTFSIASDYRGCFEYLETERTKPYQRRTFHASLAYRANFRSILRVVIIQS